MEFESPSSLQESGTELELSLDELDAILECDIVNTVPPNLNFP